MDQKHWIFISPHFDDVVLSCGGLVWDLTRQGQRVEVWTIMAGFPTDEAYSNFARQIHLTWGISGADAIRERMKEDFAACAVLGAQTHHCHWPDAIYRRDLATGQVLVKNDEELFGKNPEDLLVQEITQMLRDEVPKDAHLVLPMGLGNHIDHQAVSFAGEKLGRVDFYYADYPYVLHNFDSSLFQQAHWLQMQCDLTEQALDAWQKAVLAYTSQLGVFWRDETETRLALRNYLAGGGGRLWQKSVA